MKTYAFAAVLVGMVAPAFAGGPIEPVVEQPVVVATPVQGFDWTGFYVGANLASGRDRDSFDISTYGLQAGYLHDWGNLVLGGELAYSSGEYDDFPDFDIQSTRIKLIAGYGANRFLPYLFVGASDYTIDSGAVFSDSATLYGLGARYALGASGRHVIGLEYLLETTDTFDGDPDGLDNREFALRYDFRF